VLERVGERLLHDPISRQVDAGCDRARLALDPQVDGHPRLADLRGEVVEIAQARLRCERELVVVAAQHAEQPSHLGHRRAAGVLDRLQHGARLRPLVTDRAPFAARLHHHHRDVVGDDVVELASDPRPLFGDGELGVLLALVLELDRAGGERAGELLAAAYDHRRTPDREQDAADEHRVADDVLAVGDRHRQRHRADQAAADPSVSAARIGAGGIRGDQKTRERRARIVGDVVGRVGDGDRRRHGDEHDERGAPPPHERQRRAEREQRGDRPRRIDVGARGDLDGGHHGEHEREPEVDEPAARHARDRTPVKASRPRPNG
jgi:hypothetical protein